jgi:hypothetical protein
MVAAIAAGAHATGAIVNVKRVPETVPGEIARSAYFWSDQTGPRRSASPAHAVLSTEAYRLTAAGDVAIDGVLSG